MLDDHLFQYTVTTGSDDRLVVHAIANTQATVNQLEYYAFPKQLKALLSSAIRNTTPAVRTYNGYRIEVITLDLEK